MVTTVPKKVGGSLSLSLSPVLSQQAPTNLVIWTWRGDLFFLLQPAREIWELP